MTGERPGSREGKITEVVRGLRLERTPRRPDGSTELVDRSVNLLTHPQRGETWMRFADIVNPRNPQNLRYPTHSVYERLGILFAPGGEDSTNLIEHNLQVAANTLYITNIFRSAGVAVEQNEAVIGAAVQDSGTKYNFERKRLTREQLAEQQVAKGPDTRVVDEWYMMGVSSKATEIALNTGRLSDRYLTDPEERRRAIAERGVEAAIVSLADARTIESTVVSLEEAQGHYLERKRDKNSQDFFKDNWLPYFKDVEAYLVEASGGAFDPTQFTNDAVFSHVEGFVDEFQGDNLNVQLVSHRQ